ncbi:MAG: SPFH/Band 7/PHB domain protein [Theionarchaea archaeon]|nr:SPFH/Band 7/PHB domain protein [Theionarchaea archaeon]
MLLHLVVTIVLLVLASMSIKRLNPWEKGVVERLGKYVMTTDMRLVFVIPFVDKVIKVDMREQTMNIIPDRVITKDKIPVKVEVSVHYQVSDPEKVVYTPNLYPEVNNLVMESVTNMVKELSLKESTDEIITGELKKILGDNEGWGIKVTGVELLTCEPA